MIETVAEMRARRMQKDGGRTGDAGRRHGDRSSVSWSASNCCAGFRTRLGRGGWNGTSETQSWEVVVKRTGGGKTAGGGGAVTAGLALVGPEARCDDDGIADSVDAVVRGKLPNWAATGGGDVEDDTELMSEPGEPAWTNGKSGD